MISVKCKKCGNANIPGHICIRKDECKKCGKVKVHADVHLCSPKKENEPEIKILSHTTEIMNGVNDVNISVKVMATNIFGYILI